MNKKKKKKKPLLHDINNKPVYLGNFVEIDNLKYEVCTFQDGPYFYRDGAGWRFNFDKFKIKKV